jgi:two-component system, LuxR family, sensor kinase FixL
LTAIAIVVVIILAALLVAREITARRRERALLADAAKLELQLKENDRLVNVGQLVSSLAQDLKSPLQSMLGSAEVLAATDPSDAGTAHEVKEIRANVSRAAGIVRNLLAFTETAELDRRWHDLNEIVRSAMQQRSGEPGGRPTFQGTSRLQLVYVDGRQLEKVLGTLLSHTSRGQRAGDILVTTRKVSSPDDHMVIDIDDPAVNAADDEAVWSGDLDACRRVLEAHGGTLEVERRATGGVRFHLELPITELVEKLGT